MRTSEKILAEEVVENSMESIIKGFKSLSKLCRFDYAEVLMCAEYTGQYVYPLSCACNEIQVDWWLENPAQIKLRSGVRRGKNDKQDARRIAEYALRFQDKAQLFSLPEQNIASLKQLLGERDMYVCDRAKYQGQLSDQKRFMSKEDYSDKSKRLGKLIRDSDNCISQIEEKISHLIESDETLSNQHELRCSIDGVGEQTAVKMIVKTNGFKDFDSGRKFCCHAGVAPFRYDSFQKQSFESGG